MVPAKVSYSPFPALGQGISPVLDNEMRERHGEAFVLGRFLFPNKSSDKKEASCYFLV